MANLNQDAAKWSLFELDERHDAVVEIDCSDWGNVATRVVYAPDEGALSIASWNRSAKCGSFLPHCEVAVLSPAEKSSIEAPGHGRGVEQTLSRKVH
jgi:hypothetical protein